MKSLSAALLLALAAAAFAQGTPPTSAPVPASPPAPTYDAYIQQLRLRYQIPDTVRTPSTQRSNRGYSRAQLLEAVAQAAYHNVPLEVIENVGDARIRFLKDAKAAVQKLKNPFVDLDFPAIENKIAALKDEMDKVTLELEIKQRKEAMLEKRIKDLTTEVNDLTARDDVLRSLQKLESLRQQQLNRMQTMVSSQVAPQNALESAEADLAAAGVDVARRRAEIAATAHGGALDASRRLLVEVSVEVDEQRAAIAAIEDRLGALRKVNDARRQIDALTNQIQAVNELETVEQNLMPNPLPASQP